MTLSELTKQLEAAGATLEIVRLVLIYLDEKQSLIDQRRANDRERKIRQRAKKTTGHVTVTGRVTGHSVDPSPPDGFPPGIYNPINTPPSLTPSPVKRAQRAARLSEDWKPREFEGETVELEKFRDWARSAPGQKGVKADWDATWRNWMRRVREQGNVTPFRPNGYQQQQSGYQGNQPVISRAENLARMKRGLGLA
jgi:hypothetical protein